MIDVAREFAAVWGPSLWRASWQGGIVLAAAWAIARWCAFLSPRVVCWIWRLACLKLLISLVWLSPVQVAVLPPAAPSAPAPVAATQSRPVPVPELADVGMAQAFEPQFDTQPRPAAQAVAATIHRPIALAEILLPAWLVGVTFFVYRSARQWQTARRLVRSAESCKADYLSRLYQEESGRMSVRRLPRLKLSTQVEGPLLVGVWRPAIILPAQCERKFDEVELRLMLAHELAHHKRLDLAWNWLPTVATWLFFFHPFVWLMTRCWSESQEAACDEALIQRRVARPAEYGRLLLRLAALSPANAHAGLAAAGVLGAYRNLERRILTMARIKPFSPRRMFFAAFGLLLVGVISIVPWRLTAQAAVEVAEQKVVVPQPVGPAEAPKRVAASEPVYIYSALVDEETAEKARRVAGTHPITVTGRATDAEGKPVAGARVQLVSLGPTASSGLATATTDDQGRYEIRDAKLPLAGGEPSRGAFQVYAADPKHGLAWQREYYFHPVNRPQGPDKDQAPYLADAKFADDKLVADLKFGAVAAIGGRLLDEAGQPISGAKIELAQCHALANKPKADAEGDSEESASQAPSNAASYLMFLVDGPAATTNADGKFEITGLRKETTSLLRITHPDFGYRSIKAAVTDDPNAPTQQDGRKIFLGDVNLRLPHARQAQLHLVYGDTEAPAVKAAVSAWRAAEGDIFASGKTDDSGNVNLTLPPGEYQLTIKPDRGAAPAGFLKTTVSLAVKESPREQPSVVQVPAGCTLEIAVTDADTNKAIPNVAIATSQESASASGDDDKMEMRIIIGHADASGKFHKLVAAGKRRFQPVAPRGYSVFKEPADPVDLAAGKTVSLSFKLQKRGAAEDKPQQGASVPAAPAGAPTGTFKANFAQSAPATKPMSEAHQSAVAALKKVGGSIEPTSGGGVALMLTRRWTGKAADLDHLNDLESLKLVVIEDCTLLSPTGLAPLKKLKTPASLWLDQVSDEQLEALKDWDGVNNLSVVSNLVTDAGVKAAATLPNVTRLLLDGKQHAPGEKSKVTDAGLALLAHCRKLQQLTLNGYPLVTGRTLGELAGLADLEGVALLKLSLGDEGWAEVAKLTQLKRLQATTPLITSTGYSPLKKLTALDQLALSEAANLDDAAAANLADLTQLRKLVIHGAKLADGGLASIAGLKKLQIVNLWGSFTDAGLARLTGLARLHTLDLWGESEITDAGLKSLAGLSRLKQLSLPTTQVTDAGLKPLAACGELESLSLQGSRINGSGLTDLKGLAKLRSLALSKSQVTDAQLAKFAELPALEKLYLANTPVTDKGLASLARLPHLDELSLTGDKITDAGLDALADLKTLRTLRLDDTQVTDEGKKRLKAKLPQIDLGGKSWIVSATLIQYNDSEFTRYDDDPQSQKKPQSGADASSTEASKDRESTRDGTLTTGTFSVTVDSENKIPAKRPITVTGRATNADGKPVAGATVYLAPARFLGSPAVKNITKTTTNAAGEYEFRDFALPLQGDDRVGGYQVYGAAPGLGLAWQGSRYFHDIERPKPGERNPSTHQAEQVYANDKLTADLRFGPATKLVGRFVDEQDKPIADAKVKMFQCRALTSKKTPREDQYLIRIAEEIIASTDADGRFSVSGLPDKSVAVLQISLPDSSRVTVHAATGDGADITPAKDGKGIKVGEVNFKFSKARVQVLYGDTETPAKGASVGAALDGAEGVFVSGKTNEQGLAALSLPVGKYQLGITPGKGDAPIEFVSASLPLVVGDAPQEQPTIARIPAGCTLEIEVVDADSGRPIPKIGIYNNAAPDIPNLTHAYYFTGDLPQTDKDGKLRIGVEPGKRDVMPETGPDYQIVDATDKPVECVAGKTVSLKFKLRKQPKAEGKPEATQENDTGRAEPAPDQAPKQTSKQSLDRLKALGAAPANSKQIGIQSPWKGNDADLRLINDLPELDWLYLEFDKVRPAAIAEINRKSPLESLILHGLTDAILEKLPRLPACKRLILVQYSLSPDGFRLLAGRAAGLEILDLTGGPATDEKDAEKFHLTDAGLKQISQFGNLKGLQLYNANITDEGLSQLAALKSLEELNINMCPQVHGPGYASLARIKSLRRLAAFGQPIGGAELLGLAKLTQLESLKLSPANLGPVAIQAGDVAELAKLANLQSFDLMAFDWKVKQPFGNELLRAAGRMKSLRSLRIYAVKVEAEGIEALATADNLRELYTDVEFKQRSLEAIASLKHLQKLGLSGAGAINDAALQKLAKLTSLTQLSIAGCGIDDKGLAQFGDLRALEMLVLSESQITGAGLTSLDKLTKLTTLTLANSPFDNEGCRLLARLPKIERLDLSNTKITNDAIASICELKNLQMLTLDHDAINAKGLLPLKDLKRLSYISAAGLPGSERDTAALYETLKEVQISTALKNFGEGTTGVFIRNRDADE